MVDRLNIKLKRIRKVLITGGLGFLGSHISKLLIKKKKKVVVYDDLTRGKKINIETKKNIKIIIGDINNKKKLKKSLTGIDTVIHCAAINGTKNFYSKPIDVLNVGVLGIFNLLEACRENKVKNFFLASSSEVYHLPNKIPTDENVKLSIPNVFNPRYSYAGSKIISELITIHFGKKYFKKTIIFRPHNVYGPNSGRDHVIPELIFKVKQNSKIIRMQGTGSETRSFIHIDDFIKAFDIILKKGKNLNIYNIGTEERVSIIGLLRIIIKELGYKTKIKKISLALGGTPHRCPNIKKIKNLGFVPSIKLKDGIKKILNNHVY